ncbi:hypothetical protein [Brevundimonas faecalis]|uniref:SH3 domain-containing protein n=1 Tax=Brevundimonas faecalis TaxID=947378 RepID=A0ABV2RAD3_9CAUL
MISTRRPSITAALAGLLMANGTPAAAREPTQMTPMGDQACALQAWINDIPGRDVEVRANPHVDAQVIGTLPHTGPDDDRLSIHISITASNSGWLKIQDASDDDADRARPVYSGQGWIEADAVRFGIQSGRGFAAPDARSDRVVDLDDNWATEMGRIEKVLDCRQDWVLIDFVQERRRDGDDRLIDIPVQDRLQRRAWFRGVCDAQETTCDMRSVDLEP